MQVHFHTLGCKVNQYETEEIAEALEKRGFTVTPTEENADIFVVNSCTVTAESDRKTRQLVRKLKHRYPQSIIVLTGCMTQAFPQAGEALPEADVVLGNNSNLKLPDLLERFLKTGERQTLIQPHITGERFCGAPITGFTERTRANMKIEDGCDRFCSYCIIPTARGRVRSKPLEEIRKEAAGLAHAHFREIVLVGINLSAYGKDTGAKFYEAVAAAGEPEGILRVRLGSLEPDHLTDEVLDGLSEIPKLCPQFHISLQSGCDRVLRRMNRHYTADEYAALCEKLRSRFADCSLTTDIMVGFPGESEADFLETVAFAEKIGFQKIHVFPYSVRSGTRAAEMPDQIERREKERRAAVLLKTADRLRQNFLQSQVGKTDDVLLESRRPDGSFHGYTANYTPVCVHSPSACSGQMLRVRLVGVEGDFVRGEPV